MIKLRVTGNYLIVIQHEILMTMGLRSGKLGKGFVILRLTIHGLFSGRRGIISAGSVISLHV